MIDQPLIKGKDGWRAPLDDPLGSGFAAISVNCDAQETLHEDDLSLLNSLDARFASISSGSGAPFDIEETENVLAKLFGAQKALLVIRLDRFLIDVLEGPNTWPQLEWLRENYGAILQDHDVCALASRASIHSYQEIEEDRRRIHAAQSHKSQPRADETQPDGLLCQDQRAASESASTSWRAVGGVDATFLAVLYNKALCVLRASVNL